MSEIKKNLMDLNEVLAEAKRFDETEVATVGDGFEVEFYPLFSSDKIDNLVEVSGSVMNSDEEKGKPFVELINSSDENITLFIHFMMVREFTHLGQQMESTKPSELFPYFEALIKTGYLAELVEEVFLPEEMRKVFKRVAGIAAVGVHMSEFGLEFMEELEKNRSKIENIKNVRDRASDYQKKQETKTDKKK